MSEGNFTIKLHFSHLLNNISLWYCVLHSNQLPCNQISINKTDISFRQTALYQAATRLKNIHQVSCSCSQVACQQRRQSRAQQRTWVLTNQVDWYIYIVPTVHHVSQIRQLQAAKSLAVQNWALHKVSKN